MRAHDIEGVVGTEPCARKVMTLAARDSTGQRWGWPERPCPIVSLRTPFFCWVKVRVTKVAAGRSASGQRK